MVPPVMIAASRIWWIADLLSSSPMTISMIWIHRRVNSPALTPMIFEHSAIFALSRVLILREN